MKISVTNKSAKKAVTKTFTLVVPNFSCAALPNLKPASDAYGVACVGVAFDSSHVDCTPAKGWTVKASGLPSGLKWDAKKGVITGATDPAKPNLSAMKLTYTPKTGIFKGSFNIYATNEAVTPEGKQPKLKKFTVNFTGLVVGGRGDGQATMKKPAAGPWAVTIDEKSPSLTG